MLGAQDPSVIEQVGGWLIENAVALMAFGVAAAALWCGTLGPERSRRRAARLANVEVRFETYQVPDFSGSPKCRSRFVIHNHGPADALGFAIEEVRDVKDVDITAIMINPEFPIQCLASGQEFHIRALRTASQGDPHMVVMRWSGKDIGTEFQVKRWISAQDIV